jgi:uncharacterized protein YhaN
LEARIQAKRGALEQVGGQVAKSRSEDLRDALDLLKDRERDLELNYEAWKLLKNMLLEAEQAEGVHLGRLLGDAILQRFRELTAGRYGALTLGPHLDAGAIAIAGAERSLDALSVGTREQLSLVFRLTIAEQLQTVVVLDDQLTQSDSQRLAWLSNLLRQTAENIQILIFTCRPSDYLTATELKAASRQDYFGAALRSIDLAQAIERS